MISTMKSRPYRPPAEPGIAPGPHPPAEENRELGRRVRAGKAAEIALEARGDVAGGPEREILLRAIRDGQEARQALVEGNLALAVRMGNDLAARTGREADDAIGDALVGLTRAASGAYDPDGYGTAFSTYATWKIRGAFAQSGRNDAPVRPLKDGRCVFWGQGVPTGEDGWEMDRGGVAVRVRRGEPGEDEESDPGDGAGHAAEVLDRLMGCLGPREREVISRRYGLGGHPRHTLAQVGAVLGVTKERIRQIEQVAMGKLRKASALASRGEGGPDGGDDPGER